MILSIDPGKTTGLAFIDYTPTQVLEVVGELVDVVTPTIAALAIFLRFDLLVRRLPSPVTEVVVEDYRVYAAKAGTHVGARLFTAELIGAIRAIAGLYVPPIPVVVYPASRKNLWPDRRLRKWGFRVDGMPHHALDALKLGLQHLEKEHGWTPK